MSLDESNSNSRFHEIYISSRKICSAHDFEVAQSDSNVCFSDHTEMHFNEINPARDSEVGQSHFYAGISREDIRHVKKVNHDAKHSQAFYSREKTQLLRLQSFKKSL